MIKVGITGGIGSGKTTVCRLFAALGVPVYDSDSQAKRLMEEDPQLRESLAERFGQAIYATGHLDRKMLAARVFGNPAELAALNALVHPAVMRDFERWSSMHEDTDYVMLESAILFEAGLASYVDRTLAVVAPLELRIERTCQRDGATPEEVRRRIAAQFSEEELRARADYVVTNVDRTLLEGEVRRLDGVFRNEAKKDNA